MTDTCLLSWIDCSHVHCNHVFIYTVTIFYPRMNCDITVNLRSTVIAKNFSRPLHCSAVLASAFIVPDPCPYTRAVAWKTEGEAGACTRVEYSLWGERYLCCAASWPDHHLRGLLLMGSALRWWKNVVMLSQNFVWRCFYIRGSLGRWEGCAFKERET